jgi:PAS domain S-box-containing protein
MNDMKQLFQALSKTGDGAFIINEQRRIIFWNQAAQTILGFTADEVINQPCYKVLGGRDGEGRMLCQHYCQVTINTVKGNTLPNMDMYAHTKDGEGQWINVTTFALPTGNGSLGYMTVHLFRDATQKKINERFVEEIMTATKELRNEAGPSGLTRAVEFSTDPDPDVLTPRERQVLLLLAQGLNTDEMAHVLHISSATIRNHVQNILSKLRVHSRLEAVAYAYQQGLIDVSEQ